MKQKSKTPTRAPPLAYFSTTPWAGFARGSAPREEALPLCTQPRCRRAKLCIAAHENLFCQRTHFSANEKDKFDRASQQAFNKKFPPYPKGTPWELREKRVQAIMAYRKSQQQELALRWKAGEFDHLYGKWRRGGVLLKPPPKDYVELR